MFASTSVHGSAQHLLQLGFPFVADPDEVIAWLSQNRERSHGHKPIGSP